MKRQEKIEALKTITYEMFPDAKTELEYNNNFQLLIAIIMSAQATDRQVNIINRNFFEFLKSPEDGIKLWVEEITEFISSVSFFNNKAKNIFKTCEILIDKHQSLPPKTIDELIKLPWVGIKTAKVYLSVTEDAPYLGVDTHVHRVLNRVWIVKTNTPEQTDKVAEKILKNEDLAYLHHSLILFGRYHCMAKKPKCSECKLVSACSYKEKNLS